MSRLSRKKLVEIISDIISQEYNIVDEKDSEDGCRIVSLVRNNEKFELTYFVKNISSAYLSYDATVDRIQIPPIPSIKKTTKNSAFLLFGVKDNVLVGWNPQRYTHHDKYRSAYIFQENISRGMNNGFYSTMDHENKIYVCMKGHFRDLLEEYISDTYVGEMEW